jgi:dihydrofolate reductase
LFALALPLADKLYVTKIGESFEGDVHFPPFDPAEWRLAASEDGRIDENNRHPHRFEVYERISPQQE